MSFLECHKTILYINVEHFEIIRFLSYAADKQTNKQTDGLECTTHSDRQSRGR